MKKLPITVLTFFVALISCESVVNIDLPKSQPLLVVGGGIFHNVNGGPATQQITLTTTQQFFDQGDAPEVTDATVSVSDGQNDIAFEHKGSGVYEAGNFVSEEGKTYTLNIAYRGDRFEASETLPVGVPIEKIYTEFDDGDNIFDSQGPGYAVKLDIIDPADVENFYLWKLHINGEYIVEPDPSNKLSAIRTDELFNGQPLKGLKAHEDFLSQPGDKVRAEQYSITSGLYRYYLAFFTLTGGGSLLGDPPPSGLKGNVLNLTDQDGDAAGYFQVSAVSSREFDIEE